MGLYCQRHSRLARVHPFAIFLSSNFDGPRIAKCVGRRFACGDFCAKLIADRHRSMLCLLGARYAEDSEQQDSICRQETRSRILFTFPLETGNTR